MPTDDYLADYALLGLQPGCSLATLERSWRQGVSALHPDRAAPGSDPSQLGRRMHDLSAAYKRLRQFEREHGRLPGAPLPSNPASHAEATGHRVEPIEAPEMQSALSHSAPNRGGWWLPALALGAAIAISIWGLDGSGASNVPAVGRTEPAVAAPRPPATLAIRTPAIEPAVAAELPPAGAARRIRVGSTEAEVERLMGTPIAAGPDLWEYGPSHVRFERGRVVGWYSSPLLPLPVDSEQR
jgi:hypothetical protein